MKEWTKTCMTIAFRLADPQEAAVWQQNDNDMAKAMATSSYDFATWERAMEARWEARLLEVTLRDGLEKY